MPGILELEGHWWPPGGEQTPWQGILRDKGDYFTLTVLDKPPDEPLGPVTRRYSVLHGSIFGSGPVSLEDCFDGQVFFSAQLVKREIAINRIYEGCLLPADPDKRLFRRAICSFPQLKAFLSRTGFTTKSLKTPRGFDLSYRQQAPVRIHTDAGLEIEIGWRATPVVFAAFDEKALVHEAAYVAFTPPAPAAFSFFDACITTMRDFLTLASRRVRSPTFVELECSFDTYRASGGRLQNRSTRLLRKSSYVSEDKRPLHPLLDLTFSAEDTPGGLAPTLERWFAVAPLLLPVRNLLAASTANRGFLEDTFLASVQGLETLHRRLRSGRYMAQRKYDQEIFTSLRDAIPHQLSADHQEALTDRLRFGNDYDLRSRLKDLFIEHREALEHIFGSFATIDDEFQEAAAIRRARNYLTHYPRRKNEPSEKADLLRLTDISRTLLEFCLMGAAGFAATAITKLTQTGAVYERQMRQWR